MSMASVRIPAWLKPEHGRLGRGFAAFLDHAPAGLAARVVLLWFVILYTAFAMVSSGALGPDAERLRSFVLGLDPAAGYAGHEPLAPWLAGAWFRLFPRTDWPFHLLATIAAAAGLLFAYRIAALYLQGDKRIVALLLLLLTPFYQFLGQGFGAAETMLWTWPAATLCFLRAYATRDLMWSVLAGITAGLAVLGSYQSLFLIAGFVLAVLADPRRATFLRSTAPWLALATAALVLTPHAAWLAGEAERSGWAQAAAGAAAPPWAAALGGLGAALLIAFSVLAVGGGRGLRDAVSDPDGRMLLAILLAPLLLPFLAAAFLGGAPLSGWPAAAPWFLVPVILLRPATALLTRTVAIRIAALAALATLATLAAAPWLAWHPGETDGREFHRRIGTEVTKAWRLATGQPLRVVTGDPTLAAATAFYSPDRPVPQAVPPAGGYAAICRTDDEACVTAAKQQVAGNTNAQFITFSTISPYPGKSGQLGRFTFILVPAPGTMPLPPDMR